MPMSYNAWLYGYGNPVRYKDPRGKCIDSNNDNICDEIYLPTYDNGYALADFDETLGKFTDEDKLAIENALLDVANAYSSAYEHRILKLIGECDTNINVRLAIQPAFKIGPISTFISIHGGKITFRKYPEDPGYSARVQHSRSIFVYDRGTLARWR